MADRTSARLFGKFFSLLAENPTEENKKLAKELYEMTGDYDFSPDQMNVDQALFDLDIEIESDSWESWDD